MPNPNKPVPPTVVSVEQQVRDTIAANERRIAELKRNEGGNKPDTAKKPSKKDAAAFANTGSDAKTTDTTPSSDPTKGELRADLAKLNEQKKGLEALTAEATSAGENGSAAE